MWILNNSNFYHSTRGRFGVFFGEMPLVFLYRDHDLPSTELNAVVGKMKYVHAPRSPWYQHCDYASFFRKCPFVWFVLLSLD